MSTVLGRLRRWAWVADGGDALGFVATVLFELALGLQVLGRLTGTAGRQRSSLCLENIDLSKQLV